MAYTTLVSTEALAVHLADPGWVVFDCRHDLARPDAGAQEYREGHIPGAYFMHLDRDLAGPMTGRNGRHPLPDPAALCANLRRAGVGAATQVVAYDAHGGMFAARLWWLMRWIGHPQAAVLDGGWTRWTAEGRASSVETPSDRAGDLSASLQEVRVEACRVQGSPRLVDARAPDRFRGENETLDPVGGRIPGALNRFFRDNLGPDGRFKSPEALRKEWNEALAGTPPAGTVHYCGSGVTACHNVLAMEIAGLPGSRLYPGSWSEWCADPSRPVARGPAESS